MNGEQITRNEKWRIVISTLAELDRNEFETDERAKSIRVLFKMNNKSLMKVAIEELNHDKDAVHGVI